MRKIKYLLLTIIVFILGIINVNAYNVIKDTTAFNNIYSSDIIVYPENFDLSTAQIIEGDDKWGIVNNYSFSGLDEVTSANKGWSILRYDIGSSKVSTFSINYVDGAAVGLASDFKKVTSSTVKVKFTNVAKDKNGNDLDAVITIEPAEEKNIVARHRNFTYASDSENGPRYIGVMGSKPGRALSIKSMKTSSSGNVSARGWYWGAKFKYTVEFYKGSTKLTTGKYVHQFDDIDVKDHLKSIGDSAGLNSYVTEGLTAADGSDGSTAGHKESVKLLSGFDNNVYLTTDTKVRYNSNYTKDMFWGVGSNDKSESNQPARSIRSLADASGMSFIWTGSGDMGTRLFTEVPFYTVTFDSNGGSYEPDNQYIASGGYSTRPTNPTKSNSYGSCTLNGWKENSSTFNFSTAITQDHDLLADWDCPTYTAPTIYVVNYYVNGVLNKTENKEAGTTTTAPSITLTGCDSLDGWYTSSSYTGTKATFPYTVNSNLAFYAKTYDSCIQVNFNLNGGTWNGSDSIPSQNIPKNSRAARPSPDPTKQGFVFGGWYTDNNTFNNTWNFSNTVSQSMTLHAKWTESAYTVKYFLDGVLIDTQSKTNGQTTRPPSPIDAGDCKVLDGGWYTNSSYTGYQVSFPYTVSGDVNFYAKTKNVCVTVQFNLNSGKWNGNSSIPNQTIDMSQNGRATEPSPKPTRSGYVFKGWYTDNNTFNNAWNFSTLVTQNMTLHAKWVPVYTVNFYVDGELYQTYSKESGESLSRPTNPTATGCNIFNGWYTSSTYSGNAVSFPVTVTSNLNYYGQINNTCVTVQFNLNNGKWNGNTSIPNQTINKRLNEKATKPSPDPTKTKAVFKGWYTDDGTFNNLYNFNELVANNMILHAKWVPVYTVTFVTGDGATTVPSQDVESGNKATEPSPPSRPGYKFDRWYTDQAGTIAYNFNTSVTSDITLYARWINDVPVVNSGVIIVRYIDIDTLEPLDDDVISVGLKGDTFRPQRKTFNNYTLVETPPKETYTYLDDAQIVFFKYKNTTEPQKGTIRVKYVDENEVSISPDVISTGNVGNIFVPSIILVDGYYIVQTPEKDSYLYELEEQVLYFRYKKFEDVKQNGVIIVKYMEAETNVELDMIISSNTVGETFHPEERLFDGYKLIERPEREEYYYEESPRVLYYRYMKNEEVKKLVVENPKTGVGTGIAIVAAVSGGLYSAYWVLKKRSMFSRV